MKRIAAAIVLFLWSSLALAGWLPLAFSFNQLFFAANGSDSNPCTAAAPCLTLTKANAGTYPVNTRLLFRGGDTFGGGSLGIVLTTTNAPSGGVTVTSYGTGQATISSGNSAECVKWTNLPSIFLVNFICGGGGTATSTTDGLLGVNSQAGNTKLAGLTISGVTVSGYGLNCISIVGTNGTSGFDGINIINPTAHDCTGNDPGAGSLSCISVGSSPGYGFGTTAPSHLNVLITGFNIYNCNGKAGASNWTGSGAHVSQSKYINIGTNVCLGVLTPCNVVHDFGANSNFAGGGPVGAWVSDSDCAGGGLSYLEVYNGKTATVDGDGIDFDGGTINCIADHYWVHDNAGYGALADNYQDSANLPWGPNTYRFGLSQNNAKGEIGFFFNRAATAPVSIYNNTLINEIAGFNTVFFSPSGSNQAITGTIANNIIVGDTPISIAHPSSLSFTGNNYWNYGSVTANKTSTFTWNGSSYTGSGATGMATAFTTWQTATSQEKISGSNVGLTVNPSIYVPGGGFINGGYVPANLMAYNLQAGSPMIGTGLNLTTQFGINPGSTDYYGAAVSAASLPIGAAAGDFTSFAATSTAATNFLARVSSFTKADNVNYNSILSGMVSDGDLALTDALYLLAAPNSAASLLNLKSASFSLVATGSPPFTIRQGYTGGPGKFLDTGFVPSTAGGNWTLTSGTQMSYDLTSPGDDNAAMGAANVAGTSESTIFAGNAVGGQQFYADMNDFSGMQVLSITDSKGLSGMNRVGTALTAYRNGTGFPRGAGLAAVALPDVSVYLMGYHNGGSGLASPSADSFAAHLLGGGGISVPNVSRRLNSFMQAYGINTY